LTVKARCAGHWSLADEEKTWCRRRSGFATVIEVYPENAILQNSHRVGCKGEMTQDSSAASAASQRKF